MIISHEHKFIFIKSEKTAGTSIEAALSNCCNDDDIVTSLGDFAFNRNKNGQWIHHAMNAGDYQQHDWALTIKDKVGPEIWNDYYKFSIIRNPWDRAVSNFHWEKRQDTALIPRKRFYHHLGVPFDELANLKKQFSEYIKSDKWDNNDSFYLIDGELCVDFLIRYENLLEDFNKVCKKIDVQTNSLPHLKSGIRKKGSHYSEYFDEESKAIVEKRHRNDIRLFGYKFETA
jgi:hypothetical protein